MRPAASVRAAASASGASDDQTEMPGVELVLEFADVERGIAAEQSLNPFGETLRRRAPHQLELGHVFGRHRRHHPVDMRAVGIEYLPQRLAREAAGLVHDELPQQPVAGRVAPQHGVEANPVASRAPRLRDRHRGNRLRPSLTPLDGAQGVFQALGNRGAQPRFVLGIEGFPGFGQSAYAGEDRFFDLCRSLPQPSDELSPDSLQRIALAIA